MIINFQIRKRMEPIVPIMVIDYHLIKIFSTEKEAILFMFKFVIRGRKNTLTDNFPTPL
jgi:hypothetical protein